jgi:hypothetical protein
MSQAFGDNSWIGVGVESTFGTPVARTKFFEFMSESVKLDAGLEARSSLRGRSRNRRGQKKHAVAGTVEFQLQVDGMEVFLKNALGSSSTSGAGPYTHTISLARALPTGLSVELNRDASNIGGSSAFLYDGCQIAKMTLKHSPGDFLKMSVDLVGEGDSSLVAVSTPTFATFVGWDWDSFAATINGVSVSIKDLEITLDNNLATERYNLGSNKRKGFGGNGNRMISGKISVEFASLTELNYWRNQSAGSFVCTWTNGTSSLVFSVANPQFIEGEPTVSGAGPTLVPLAFDGYLSSVEGDEISIILTNSTSSIP